MRHVQPGPAWCCARRAWRAIELPAEPPPARAAPSAPPAPPVAAARLATSERPNVDVLLVSGRAESALAAPAAPTAPPLPCQARPSQHAGVLHTAPASARPRKLSAECASQPKSATMYMRLLSLGHLAGCPRLSG